MGQPCSLVFDIGKSNKKILLFDEYFREIYHENVKFDEIVDDDGFLSEDINSLTSWIHDKVEQIFNDKQFDLMALNFATYGASLVNIDDEGNVVTPFYNYLKPFPEDLKTRFFDKYFYEKEFSMETSSPLLGMLNSGLQLYFLKHSKPALFKRIHKSIHFPQYLSSLFTKKYFTDYTSLGCHTGMWDYQANRYSNWIEKEGFSKLFAPVVSSRISFPVNIHGREVKVGIGVHDSSSNLVPYFQFGDSFVLISTGTWSICLNPFSTEGLTRQDLDTDCLQFLSVNGDPVKASRLFLGKQFHHTVNQLGEYFNLDYNFYKNVGYDKQFVSRLTSSKTLSFDHGILGVNRFGFVNNSRPDFSQFNNFEDAYLHFMDEITDLQIVSLKIAVGNSRINKVIIDGGFSNNKVFVQMLANKLPAYDLYSNSSSIGTAIGAAILVSKGKWSYNDRDIEEGLKRHYPVIP